MFWLENMKGDLSGDLDRIISKMILTKLICKDMAGFRP